MEGNGLSLRVTERDGDYLGVELTAWNTRYAGTTFLYLDHNELDMFADAIADYPADAGDERSYEFGVRGQAYAGGYCRLHFRSAVTGMISLGVTIEDAGNRHQSAQAEFSIEVEPARLDRFVESLHAVGRGKRGESVLG